MLGYFQQHRVAMENVNPPVLINALQNKMSQYFLEVSGQLAHLRNEMVRTNNIRRPVTVNAATQTTNDDQETPSVGHSMSSTTTSSVPTENHNPPMKVYTARRSTGTTLPMMLDRDMDKLETSTESKDSESGPKSVSKIHDKCVPNVSQIPMIDLSGSPDIQPINVVSSQPVEKPIPSRNANYEGKKVMPTGIEQSIVIPMPAKTQSVPVDAVNINNMPATKQIAMRTVDDSPASLNDNPKSTRNQAKAKKIVSPSTITAAHNRDGNLKKSSDKQLIAEKSTMQNSSVLNNLKMQNSVTPIIKRPNETQPQGKPISKQLPGKSRWEKQSKLSTVNLCINIDRLFLPQNNHQNSFHPRCTS